MINRPAQNSPTTSPGVDDDKCCRPEPGAMAVPTPAETPTARVTDPCRDRRTSDGEARQVRHGAEGAGPPR
jgi:hypothetical protein